MLSGAVALFGCGGEGETAEAGSTTGSGDSTGQPTSADPTEHSSTTTDPTTGANTPSDPITGTSTSEGLTSADAGDESTSTDPGDGSTSTGPGDGSTSTDPGDGSTSTGPGDGSTSTGPGDDSTSTGDGSTSTGEASTSTSDASTSTGPSDDSTTDALAVCGDGVLDPGEACDDGNVDAADACSATCGEQAALSVTMGHEYTCALLTGGTVKCWGRNYGQLGLEDKEWRGDEPDEMGDMLPPVQLGGTVVQIDNGFASACARFDDGRIKCWGTNEHGELGLGNLLWHGGAPGQMGDALPYVDLGPGRTAVSVSVGDLFACAVLDDSSVKCWGLNWLGELGLGDTLTRGDEPNEMGADLPPVDLGQGVKATRVITGVVHACALLEGGSVKCWGRGNLGQLGLGDDQIHGDEPGEMGDALPMVDLGQGAVVTALASGGGHVCALLDTQAIKCWGDNSRGQLGLGDTENRGDAPGEMGDNLPTVDLGQGQTAVAIGTSIHSTCALLGDGTVKCWGFNAMGQLGIGSYNDRGDDPGEMGDALPFVDLGAGQTAVSLGITEEGTHQCAVLATGAVKCWGQNWSGQLGIGDAKARGTQPGDMGDNLPHARLFSPVW